MATRKGPRSRRAKRKSARVEELTDLMEGMSPTQLAALEGFIAGESQGQNIRGVQDYDNMTTPTPGLGVSVDAPTTAFGGLPTLSDTSAAAGVNRAAVAGAENAAMQRRLAEQAATNTGVQPEEGRSLLGRVGSGLKRAGGAVRDFVNQGDFDNPTRSLRPRGVSPDDFAARQKRVKDLEEAGEGGLVLMEPTGMAGFGGALDPVDPSLAQTTPPATTRTPAKAGRRRDANADRLARNRKMNERARQRAMERGERLSQRMASRANGSVDETPVNARENVSPMGVRGPQDQMTQGTEQVSSTRNVPKPKPQRTQEPTQSEMAADLVPYYLQRPRTSTSRETVEGSGNSVRSVPPREQTYPFNLPRGNRSEQQNRRLDARMMNPRLFLQEYQAQEARTPGRDPNLPGEFGPSRPPRRFPTVESTQSYTGGSGAILRAGDVMEGRNAGAQMLEDPGRVKADAEPQKRLLDLERQATALMQKVQGGDQSALSQLEGIFSEVDRIERQVAGAGRPPYKLDTAMSATSDVRSGQGQMGGSRVPTVMQSRNLRDLRNRYNSIVNAGRVTGGRGARRAAAR